MATQTSNKKAMYKGKWYRLDFRGKTKFSPDKAKLSFWDGSKSFWVDGNLLEAVEENSGSTSSSNSSSTYGKRCYCAECGEPYRKGNTCWETGGHCIPDWE